MLLLADSFSPSRRWRQQHSPFHLPVRCDNGLACHTPPPVAITASTDNPQNSHFFANIFFWPRPFAAGSRHGRFPVISGWASDQPCVRQNRYV
ncbi:hypothetical protein KCP74_20260 [Salmonella enterica subsp. enterica]|nr:hypothetical protein KCP74_20260 [Salmonella enterica subsp. enterica]